MATQKILWTALPQGAGKTPGTLSLVVFVAPQLSGAASLTAFGDLADWPATLSKLTFTVSVGGTRIGVAPTVPAGASALWTKFFTGKTPVATFETPKAAALQDLNVRSYSVADVTRHVKDLHRSLLSTNLNALQEHVLPTAKNLAKSVFEVVPPPPTASLIPELKGLASELGLRESVAAASALTKIRPGIAPAFSLEGRVNIGRTRALSVKAADVLEARVYANSPVAKANVSPALESRLRTTRLGNFTEFHDILAILGEYPVLLTQLGLAVELTVPFTRALPPQGGTVSVTADWSKVGPATATRELAPIETALAPGAFLPRSHDGHVVGGFLKADDTAVFGTSQLDSDGAVSQLVQVSDVLTRRFAPRSRAKSARPDVSVDDAPEALPSLRTAGLSLARQGRGDMVRAAMLQGARHAQDVAEKKTPLLYAEDLVRGWRVDVREVAGGKPGPWRSLCWREGVYDVTGAPPFTSVDEGFVRATAVEQKGKDGVHVHEALFRWTGWSLVVPRPGKPADPVAPKTASDPLWPLSSKFGVPASGRLPRLRFGRTYQMRVRMADLAGRGPQASAPEESRVTAPEAFLRFDPVPPPTLVLRADAKAGESAERLVIRSLNATPADDAKPTDEKNARLVAPPPTTAELVERHGMFDTPAGVDPVKSLAALTKYQGEFKKRQAGKRTTYLKEPGAIASIAMPYLADPLAEAAAFRGLPGKPSLRASYGGRGAWPALKPFDIVLLEGAPNSEWNEAAQTLTVWLPKAAVAKVNLSSVPLDASRLEELGHWRWLMDDKSNAANRGRLQSAALVGGNWQLTPWRTVTLVHAVQKPLLSPELMAATISRSAGESIATVPTLTLACDGKSTELVQLEATWDEITDGAPSSGAKGRGPGGVTAALDRPPVTQLDRPVVVNPMVFGPNGGRVATPQALAGPTIPLRFDEGAVPASGSAVLLSDTEGNGLAFYDPAARQIVRDKARERQFRGSLGFSFPDTRHRLVTLSAVATTRFREYFPQSVWSDPANITRRSAKTVSVHVPSSSRPAAPEIAYVLPIFRWNRKSEKSVRQTGLRVYLERPWFSSGDNEKLAVVLSPAEKGGNVPNAFLPYVTQWGADPIWAAPGVARQAVAVGDLPIVSGGRGGPQVFGGAKPPTGAKIGKVGTIPPVITIAPAAADKPPTATVKIVPPIVTNTPPTVPVKTVPPVVANTPPTVGGGGFKMPPVLSVPPLALLPRKEQLFPLDEIPGTFGVETVGIAEYEVEYDSERGLWYADIPIVSPAHMPFLRLALARYQPYSVAGMHLSRVVLADFAQLLPERMLSVVREQRTRVTLSGAFPQDSDSTSISVFAQVQRQALEGDLGWVNVGDRHPMARNGDSFSVALPAVPVPAPARVMVVEVERIGGESRVSYAESMPL